MAGKFFGCEIASPEKQKRTAMGFLALIGGALVLGAVIVSYIATMEQRGRLQAMATVTDLEVRCRYVVSSIGKRAHLYDHTGYIDCAEAEEVARANNVAMGRVERSTLASVTFETAGGNTVQSQVVLYKQRDIEVGSKVEILYREASPADVAEFKSFPIFGLASIAPHDPVAAAQAAAREAALTAAANTAADAKAEARRKRIADKVAKKEIDPVGLVILIAMLVIGFFIIRRIWRLVRGWLGASPTRAHAPPRGRATSASASPAGAARLDRVAQRQPRQGFGAR